MHRNCDSKKIRLLNHGKYYCYEPIHMSTIQEKFLEKNISTESIDIIFKSERSETARRMSQIWCNVHK